jgi:Domain of unknown function (DUF4395)
MATLFTFPHPVNEKAARVVAGGVALLAVATLLTQSPWLYVLLAIGFAARTAAGPRFSLLGRLATQVIAPRLGQPKLVAGPPKRFAQGIGLVLTTAAVLAGPVLGAGVVAMVLIAVLLVFATLESVAGFCAGCWLFARLMQLGVVPESTCALCRETPAAPSVAVGALSGTSSAPTPP